MLSLLIFLTFFSGFVQPEGTHEFGVVKDPDGYTNMRAEPRIDSYILRRLQHNDFIWYIRSNSPWLKVSNYFGSDSGQNEGFVHSSRVVPITDLGIQEIEQLYGSEWERKTETFRLGEITITMFNANRIEDAPLKTPEYQSSFLEIKIPNQKPLRKYYPDINSLGGYGGLIYAPVPSYSDYLFFTKNGDYDGRAIIVRKDGNVADIEGGMFLLHGSYFISEVRQGCCGEPLVWDLSLWDKTYDSRDDDSIMDRYDIGEPQYSYYTATGELFLKVENPYNEDTKPSYYRLDKNGTFIPESDPPVLKDKVKLLPEELSDF